MPELWNYSHAGKMCGPVPREKLEELAKIGALLPTDSIWPEGDDPRRGVEALSIVNVESFGSVLAEVDLGLTAKPPPVSAMPDWLGDVQAEPEAPAPKPVPPNAPKAPRVAKALPTSVVKLQSAPRPQPEEVEEEEEQEARGFDFSRRELLMFGAGISTVLVALGFGFFLANRLFSRKTEPVEPTPDKKPEETP